MLSRKPKITYATPVVRLYFIQVYVRLLSDGMRCVNNCHNIALFRNGYHVLPRKGTPRMRDDTVYNSDNLSVRMPSFLRNGVRQNFFDLALRNCSTDSLDILQEFTPVFDNVLPGVRKCNGELCTGGMRWNVVQILGST